MRILFPTRCFIALILPMAPALACTDFSSSLSLQALSTNSQWKEYAQNGATLVTEQGQLDGVELSAQPRCDGWALALSYQSLSGNRAYSGQTVAGVPVQSHSAIGAQSLQIKLAYEVFARWSVLGKADYSAMQRDIRSTATARGYPEQLDWTMVSAGIGYHLPFGTQDLAIEAWTGTALDSHMRVTLPGADPATLAPGSMTQTALLLAWTKSLGNGWSLSAQAGISTVEIERGKASTVYRGQQAVGSAYQPRTVLTEWPLQLGIAYVF